MTVILLIVGITNLAMLIYIAEMLKYIGKELNHFERWKGSTMEHRF